MEQFQFGSRNNLAPKASPALTGVPTAPTAAEGTSTTQVATTQFVANAVDDKVDINQGVSNAGKFMMVNESGNIEATEVASWNGGSY